MKFCYVDESGDNSQSDVFVMAGVLVDAHRLRKKTVEFDALLQNLFRRHPGSPKELKTKAFINGNGGWSAIPGVERQQFLRDVCQLAVDKGDKVYAFALSIAAFTLATSSSTPAFPFQKSYWVCAAMFIAGLIQKKMQSISGKKGITALVMDDNKVEMPRLSDGLFTAPAWYDGLYQMRRTKRGKLVWAERTDDDRFDHIINTGFSVRSEHSSLVQMADTVSWVFRRHLELKTAADGWTGEREFYSQLHSTLDEARITLGQTPICVAKDFYSTIAYPEWKL